MKEEEKNGFGVAKCKKEEAVNTMSKGASFQ